MSRLLKDLRRHVSRRTACRRQDVELFLVHDSAEPKIRNQQVRVVLGGSEQEVLGL